MATKPPKFEPSAASLAPTFSTPSNRTIALLKHIQKLTEALQDGLPGEVPLWVLERVHQAATSLSTVASFAAKPKPMTAVEAAIAKNRARALKRKKVQS